MSLPTTNPFSMVYDALWELFEAYPDIDDLVLPGNRIKYNKDKVGNPLPQHINDADLPEIVLATDGIGQTNLHQTSCSSSITRTFSWLLSTGDFRLNERLLPVEWMIFVAMHDWQTVLADLLWEGKSFVTRADLLECTNGLSDPDLNRKITGWSAVWRIEVEMHFKHADLLEILDATSQSSSQGENHGCKERQIRCCGWPVNRS